MELEDMVGCCCHGLCPAREGALVDSGFLDSLVELFCLSFSPQHGTEPVGTCLVCPRTTCLPWLPQHWMCLEGPV